MAPSTNLHRMGGRSGVWTVSMVLAVHKIFAVVDQERLQVRRCQGGSPALPYLPHPPGSDVSPEEATGHHFCMFIFALVRTYVNIYVACTHTWEAISASPTFPYCGHARSS